MYERVFAFWWVVNSAKTTVIVYVAFLVPKTLEVALLNHKIVAQFLSLLYKQ